MSYILKDLVMSALTLLFLQQCSENESSSASSDFSASSASDFNISRTTFLLHNALDELRSIRPALAELKDWQHSMQSLQTEFRGRNSLAARISSALAHQVASKLARKKMQTKTRAASQDV
jgi:hypothetical protein